MSPRSYQNGDSLLPVDDVEEGQVLSSNKKIPTARRRVGGWRWIWWGLFLASAIVAFSQLHHHHENSPKHSSHKSSASTQKSDSSTSDFGDDSGASTKSEKQAQKVAETRLQKLNQHVPQSSDCEATILLMRHCEKLGPDHVDEAGNEHCTYLGYQRAEYLATLFDHGNKHDAARWPRPQQLYAYRSTRSHGSNFREWETLKPLSDATGVDITLADTSTGLADDLFDWLNSDEACGQATLISWRHSKIPQLAQALGCGPDNGCPSEYPGDSFDWIWQLQFVYNQGGGARQQQAYRAQEQALGGESSLPEEKNEGHKEWRVYATVDRLGFDPLAFGRKNGKYP